MNFKTEEERIEKEDTSIRSLVRTALNSLQGQAQFDFLVDLVKNHQIFQHRKDKKMVEEAIDKRLSIYVHNTDCQCCVVNKEHLIALKQELGIGEEK